MLQKQKSIFQDTINHIFLPIWDSMIYVYKKYKNNRQNWHEMLK